MESREALGVLGELSSAQWGLLTSAQASRRGVSRLDLSRLADAGLIERVSHGVYRDAGAGSDEFDDLRATWLAIDPKVDAEARLADVEKSVVVSGASAARLHGIGDLRTERSEFTSSVRRQSQRAGVHFTIRLLDRAQITVRHGLPVTTVERTLTDLVASRTDLTHVAAALGDALRQGSVNLDELARLLTSLAARNGLRKDDGEHFVEHLLKLAGMDTETTVNRIAAIDALAAPIAIKYLEHLAAQSDQLQQLAAIKVSSPALDAMHAQITAAVNAMQPQLESIREMQRLLAPQMDQWRKVSEELAPSLAALTTAAAFVPDVYKASSVRPALALESGELS